MYDFSNPSPAEQHKLNKLLEFIDNICQHEPWKTMDCRTRLKAIGEKFLKFDREYFGGEPWIQTKTENTKVVLE